MSEENITTPEADHADENKYFDKKAEFYAEVQPLMHQLEEACEKHGLPYVVHVVFLNDDEKIGAGCIASICGRNCAAAYRAHIAGMFVSGKLKMEQLAEAALAASLLGKGGC